VTDVKSTPTELPNLVVCVLERDHVGPRYGNPFGAHGRSAARHGALAKKSDIAEFNEMLKTARERVKKMFDEGKSEMDVVAARPLNDLDAKWAANDEAAIAFLKMVYNSFKRS
jgi:hypothetical protein